MKAAESILLASLLPTAPIAHAVIDVSTIQTADDVAWTLPGKSADVVDNIELYDERQLNITGANGLTVASVRIILDTTGTFDDSIAMDIDADGTIDFLSTQDDAYDSAGIGQGVYAPWVDATPYTFDAVITSSGTSLTSYWDGVEILHTSGAEKAFGFNNASGFTLQDWGFGANGLVTSDNFTTDSMRLGNINVAGPSGHDIDFSFDAIVIEDTGGTQYIFDPDGDGVPLHIPEPATITIMGLICGAGLVIRRFFML